MKYSLFLNGTQASVDTLGGAMTSYALQDGTPCLWTGDEKYWAGHAPLLFPIVGAVKNDVLVIDDREYTMEKHGFGRKKDYVTIEINESNAHFRLTSDEETKKVYPYSFQIDIFHMLMPDGFKTEFVVTNTDAIAMRFCIGGHPGFCCPMFEGDSFSDYEVLFDQDESSVALYTDENSILHCENRREVLKNNTLRLDYSLFDQDALMFPSIDSKKITLKSTKSRGGVELSFWGFESLGIWTPPHKNAPFICLEPWQGLPAFDDDSGKLEEKPGAITLLPKEQYFCGYTVRTF